MRHRSCVSDLLWTNITELVFPCMIMLHLTSSLGKNRISPRTCEFFYPSSFLAIILFHFVTRGRVTAKLGEVDSSKFCTILLRFLSILLLILSLISCSSQIHLCLFCILTSSCSLSYELCKFSSFSRILLCFSCRLHVFRCYGQSWRKEGKRTQRVQDGRITSTRLSHMRCRKSDIFPTSYI